MNPGTLTYARGNVSVTSEYTPKVMIRNSTMT